jgi:uncharacterized protein YuzE
VKPVRWSPQALKNLVDHQIEREHADRTLVYERAYAMKVTYGPPTDSLTLCLRDGRIKESDEVRTSLIVDFGYDGGVVRFESMQASKLVQNTRAIHCR